MFPELIYIYTLKFTYLLMYAYVSSLGPETLSIMELIPRACVFGTVKNAFPLKHKERGKLDFFKLSKPTTYYFFILFIFCVFSHRVGILYVLQNNSVITLFLSVLCNNNPANTPVSYTTTTNATNIIRLHLSLTVCVFTRACLFSRPHSSILTLTMTGNSVYLFLFPQSVACGPAGPPAQVYNTQH